MFYRARFALAKAIAQINVTCYALAGEPADKRESIHKQVTDL